jgi:Uracil DNA glycosylase superfamily
MNVGVFVTQLSQISLPNVFNPYRDSCCEHDHSESAAIRRLNLQLYLETAIACGADSVWLGRDCGYRGARRTGIALTDEKHLEILERHFGIGGLLKATVGPSIKERTATEVWKVIREVNARVFLWNVFPFHPFEAGSPMSNRRHTTREFNECTGLLICLLELVKPKRIVALGADAHNGALRLGLQVSPVRHPSYGGQIEFADAMRELYK